LLSLATAVPPHVLSQQAVAERARRLFADRSVELERLLPVFDNAGVATRYSCVPLEWYLKPSDWKTRNSLYIENAVSLLYQAATRCLDAAGLAPADIDAVVTVSTTGIATPSLDARLMQGLALRRDVQRLPIFGLGCAGGVLGLARAAALARAEPGARVLFLVVELCALTFRPHDRSKSNLVAAALFGDGAAAAVVSTTDEVGGSPRIAAWGEQTWDDSLQVMGWRVENDGLEVVFSRDIPSIVRREFGAAADSYLSRQGLCRDDLRGYVCHPGGAKVIDALEETFGLNRGAMTEARAVLRDYGNMSAATVMFVLREALGGCPPGRYLLSALGPGFSAGFLTLEVP
jgi:alkylresorcinol/alkylpyrone synthase